jgi:hypothetical protein
MEGPWLTDAHMREEQALPLARWFARIGTHLPLWSLQHDLEEAASTERRWRRRAEIAGVVLEGVSDDGAAILERVDVDPAGALLALRLLGCWDSDWCELDEFDRALLRRLESRLCPRSWIEWECAAHADPMVALGLAALLWRGSDEERHRRRTCARLSPIAAFAALQQAVPMNRARVVQLLRDDPEDTALELLREALRGRILPREGVPGDAGAGSGLSLVYPFDPVHGAAYASNACMAAIALAGRGDTASRESIRTLAAISDGAEREHLLRALSLLDEQDRRKEKD